MLFHIKKKKKGTNSEVLGVSESRHSRVQIRAPSRTADLTFTKCTLHGRHVHTTAISQPTFKDEQTEAQIVEVICPRSSN